MSKSKATRWTEVRFETYFDVADEIYEALRAGRDMKCPTSAGDIMVGTPGLTLADLDRNFVKAAREWAKKNNAPWPPELPWAEEYSNDLNNGRIRG